MILTKEHLTERKKYLLNNVEKGEESAYVSAKYALDYHDTIDALTQTIAELKTEIAELSDPNWKGTALLWQREVCNALGIQTSDRATVLSAIAELTAKLADLEGIDKVADHANGVIGLMQADIDALTAKLVAVRETCGDWKAIRKSNSISLPSNQYTVIENCANDILSILDAPTKPKEARNGEE